MVSLTDKRPDKLGFKARFESFFDTTSKIVNTSDRRNPVDEESTNQPDEALVSQDAQAGVQRVQATATVWTRSHLIGAHICIWLIYFVVSLEEVVLRSLNPYVTSSFSLHSLTSATNIMSSIIGGVAKIPTAKILDTWGRPQGIGLMTFIWVIGYIMMASCKNVQTYAAAQVFSVTGAQGVSYCLTVFISDTSTLKNRSLMLSIATSPYIVTTWLGGPVSQSIIEGPGWRWGFGIFAVVVPVVVAPLTILFLYNQRKAQNQGLVKPVRISLRPEALKRYAIEVDLLGIIILASGMALFLLPFSLYSYQKDKFRSPMIICMITFGGALLVFFTFWERYLAQKTFIPFELLMDRTVFCAGLMFVFVFFNSMVWGSYFFSMLQVVWGLSITNATYVSAIYRVGSCLWALVVGLLIRWTGRFKWLALYFAIPLMMLGVGLMIEFRRPNSDIGYIVMTQIFVAFSGGTIVLCGELAMLAPSNQQHIAAIIAILNLFGSIGSAVGGTVATAIWTSVFPAALRRYLPADVDAKKVYGSIIAQLYYRPGTPARDAINRSYGEAQRYMLITSLALLGGAFVCVALWRDIRIKDIKQVKGRVI
ncbi:uncharacterized protein PV06_06505 [Exophiala oligosperma]|uniref:Major facilitator superfamily (MFS) profile domain-containing protein n=1 Tax=Exophiala oligosperma TaxID=215243 RepID=A0A0D2DCU2_9EURO|nr:uncharacterized protein PV06_06505 [Exophiala oligosperma]KIW40893.1 hypothetical protein PV06_06505 [Exophiala oligosperma]